MTQSQLLTNLRNLPFVAVFNANDAKDLGIALSTLQHYNWESNENKYSNEKTTLRRGVCLSASEAKKSKQDDN